MSTPFHYSQEQIDAAISSILGRLRSNAADDADGHLRLRTFETIVPKLIQNQMNELNNGVDLQKHIAFTMEVFGYWLSHLARNFCPDSHKTQVEFVVAATSDIANQALSKMAAKSIAAVKGDAGGRA